MLGKVSVESIRKRGKKKGEDPVREVRVAGRPPFPAAGGDPAPSQKRKPKYLLYERGPLELVETWTPGNAQAFSSIAIGKKKGRGQR